MDEDQNVRASLAAFVHEVGPVLRAALSRTAGMERQARADELDLAVLGRELDVLGAELRRLALAVEQLGQGRAP